MHAWLENQIGQSAANIITSLVVLIIVIVVIAFTITLLRKFNGGTFVVGGKSRTPRLSVRDAAAVDRTRRLVLVRRDNVEHLIMIGGPTDLVIETNIKLSKPTTGQNDVLAPTSELNVSVQPASPYREPLMTSRPAPVHESKIPDDLHMNERQKTSAPAMAAMDFASVSATNNLNHAAPKLDISASDENAGLSQNRLNPSREHRESFAPQRIAPSLDRPNPQRIEPTSQSFGLTPSGQDEITDSDLRARRESPSDFLSSNKKNVGNFDDNFEPIFEGELRDTLKNDKI